MPVARRTRQFAAVAVAALLVAGCGHKDAATAPDLRSIGSMYVGGDISALHAIEQAGGVYKDGGQAGDAIAILRAHGSNTFRLRVFVNPNGQDVVVNDLAYTVQLATRVKASGAKLLLDFHYSDTWADPGHQTTPAAWASLGLDSLLVQVETYTGTVIAALARANAVPDVVQIGNEIDGGILWPIGQLVYSGADTSGSWDRFTQLLKAGIRGVHDSLPPGDSVKIMLHYSQGGSVSGTQWFFDHINAYGVPYDLIGLSYYPYWHGTLDALEANLNATAERYGRDVVVVETAYPWRAGGWEGMGSDPSAMTWSASLSGQRQFLSDVLTAVRSVPNNHGAGVLWWYPESIVVSGIGAWADGSLALFDDSGNVLPAASVFAAGQ